MTTNRPARPHRHTGNPAPRRPDRAAPRKPAPARPGPLTHRLRGRHRKPRRRRILLAAGGLALAAGLLGLLRLTAGPATDDGTGTLEAGRRPGPVVTGTDGTSNTAATFPTAPGANPSSPTAAVGLVPSPVIRKVRPAPSDTAPTAATVPRDLPKPTTATAPGTTTPPGRADTPPPPRRTTPAPARPAPPSRTAPAPTPRPGDPEEPHETDLCVPVIGLCVDSPVGQH
ncbi:hypothetical protein [Streptomyces sp. bgisy032]|uniref:hypothetical protein n=1 Tax=Streptomyces sp. bgisy032 TaxID=3413773 RepID=UPI003D7470A4